MNKYISTWSDEQEKALAFEDFSNVHDAYEGVSRAYHRDFLDIEPNRSVRPQFKSSDYYAFRPDEQVPRRQKHIIKMCMDAYDKVGIVRNIIDLMGDFGCQGINLVHENKSVEKFYQQWFKKIDGKERSERFLNNLYRTGNVFVYKSYAKVTDGVKKYIRSLAEDIKVEVPLIEKSLIPWRYNFLNPLSVDMKDGIVNLFLGRKNYQLSADTFFDNFKDGTIPVRVLETLPPEVKRAIKQNKNKIELDPERLSIHYYKKDDWQYWAHPLVYAILDDIIMLEKMKLADLAALDGAISNIRLWTLGDFDNKILPTKAGINKLRNILASNTGGGTMELVWGPELKFTESNSQVYKFLGSEKYQSVLNSIFAGLGVPPTLTGMASNGGGFTNNFISLKTMVERLQYGRDQLTRFWEKEVEYVRKAMGFRKPAHIVYDQMSLSDEAAEKNLLVQLADRDIISHETLLERFKEVPAVEKLRLQREDASRQKEKMPPKASPFHNANHKQEIEKMEKQATVNKEKQNTSEQTGPGRPNFKQDDEPRKKRVDTPRSTPGVADLIDWSWATFDKLQTINKAYLGVKGKSNMRQLNKDEVAELEHVRLSTFLALKPMAEVTEHSIHEAMCKNMEIPDKYKHVRNTSLNIDGYKRRVIALYVDGHLS